MKLTISLRRSVHAQGQTTKQFGKQKLNEQIKTLPSLGKKEKTNLL